MDGARFDKEAIDAIATSMKEIVETLVQKKRDALRAYDEKAARYQELHESEEAGGGRKC